MALIHHHFQRSGVTGDAAIARFWLIGAILAAMAIATVKLSNIAGACGDLMSRITVKAVVQEADAEIVTTGLPKPQGDEIEAVLEVKDPVDRDKERQAALERLLESSRKSTFRSNGPYPTRDELHELTLIINVWIYLHDLTNPAKQKRAQELISSAVPYLLPWQVGCEFLAATRKLKSPAFNPERAWNELQNMRIAAEQVALPEPEDWDGARQLQQSYSLSIWDALLIATCIRHGVTTLYTDIAPRTIAGRAGNCPIHSPEPSPRWRLMMVKLR